MRRMAPIISKSCAVFILDNHLSFLDGPRQGMNREADIGRLRCLAKAGEVEYNLNAISIPRFC